MLTEEKWMLIERPRYLQIIKEEKERLKASTHKRKKFRRVPDEQFIPKCLTKAQKKEIDAIYAEAKHLTEETGIPHNVDHIIPRRKSKNVSGLHVPQNLQILTREENFRKCAYEDAKW